MDQLSRERKLELVRQIKTQYHQNQYDLYNREHLLYAASEIPEESLKNNTSESLKFRSVLAILLFLFIVLLDFWNVSLAGMEISQLINILQKDYLYMFTGWQAPL